ncbi:MAG: hypothetical protein VX341_07060 [Bdellovibrionota bacterium]|nr:hypothetical protein [Bdellovibrionota bacterium]
MIKYISLLLSLIISFNSFAQKKKGRENHNLVVIQKVSTDGTTFVIRRGLKDDVLPNQRSLFSTKDISLVAQAITVNREYSQWRALQNSAVIPFKRGDIINLSYSVEKVWTEIPRVISDENYRLTMQQAIIKKDPSKKKDFQKRKKRVQTNYQFLVGSTVALSESTQNVQDVDGTRTGLTFNGRYLRNYKKGLYYHFGLRYDGETYVSTTPNVTEETTRIFGYTGLTLRLNDIWKKTKALPYLALDIGIGTSNTAVDDLTKSGLATILPAVRLGIEYKAFKKTSFLIEAFAESISANEEFSESVNNNPTQQKTTITNVGINLGMNF